MLQITYQFPMVSIVSRVKDDDEFDTVLNNAHHTLAHFRSKGGSTWGCDGVGYFAQKKAGMVVIHKSGVGRRHFKNGMDRLKTCQRCNTDIL